MRIPAAVVLLAIAAALEAERIASSTLWLVLALVAGGLALWELVER